MANLLDLQDPVRRSLYQVLSQLQQEGIHYSIPPHGGFRTAADQADLYANRASNPNPVAVPGTSPHEKGYAVDINLMGATPAQSARATEIMKEWGFIHPLNNDPPHWEYQTSRPQNSGAWWDKPNGPAPPVLPPVGGAAGSGPGSSSETVVPFHPTPSAPSQISDSLQALIHAKVYGNTTGIPPRFIGPVQPNAAVPQGPPAALGPGSVGIPQVPGPGGTTQSPPVGGLQGLINSVRLGIKN